MDNQKTSETAEGGTFPAANCSGWGRLDAIANGLKVIGFNLARGYWDGPDFMLPTLNITRPSCPEWEGVWTTVEADEDAEAVLLVADAIRKWDDYCETFHPNSAIGGKLSYPLSLKTRAKAKPDVRWNPTPG